MKKLTFLVITFTLALLVNGQSDSALVSIGIQARDAKVVGELMKNYEVENLYDTIKVKFRGPIQSLPTGNDVINVTGYAKDWFEVYQSVWRDPLLIKSNTQSRLRTLLLAVGNTFLTNRIGLLDQKDLNDFQNRQERGLFIYRRN